MAKKIIYLLTQKEKEIEKLKQKSKQSKGFYEFNLNEQIGFDLPTINYRNKQADLIEEKRFPIITRNCLDKI